MGKTFWGFVIGAALTALLFAYVWKKTSADKREERNDTYILTNQISRMNKMVVMEQNLTSLQKTKISNEVLGGLLPGADKQIVTFTRTNAQVSYDLNKMRMEVDSVNKRLIIKELPHPDIRITPSVEIQSMDDSFFYRINEKDLKKITENAKQNALKQVNQENLRAEGRKQLQQNLEQIFVLARALNYEIVDETKQLSPADF